MQSIGGLIWRGSIVLSIAMMALISFQPSVAISTGSRSGAAQKPPAQLTKGTPAGRLVRCGRMIADRNPDPLMNRGPFFCTDDQAKWLCEMPKCYTRQKKSAKRTGLKILAVHFQEMKDKTDIGSYNYIEVTHLIH
ncbi:hypothetical protein PSHT_01923 [Puccinia striiformis]|uniref:Uncharacterized protein n=1 Tax=Puccinia striiformis TaxID=27350 RepID=A0A2S4WJC5_9BASI|nr:hypothetical protein PSHT_01923 [Puccinia striiformis]